MTLLTSIKTYLEDCSKEKLKYTCHHGVNECDRGKQ